MKIAVIGTGAVGRTLAAKLDELGHDVAMGTRDVESTLAAEGPTGALGHPSYANWQEDHPAVRLLPFAAAGAHGDLVLNAVNGANAVAAMQAVGADTLAGKVLVDLALPLDLSHGFPPALTISGDDSLAEEIQRALPDTRVVKSLNTVYMEVMVDPSRVPGEHTLFVSGDDPDAKQAVKDLLQQFGWSPARVIDLGDLATARGVEEYSMLFFALSGALGTFDFNIAVHRA